MRELAKYKKIAAAAAAFRDRFCDLPLDRYPEELNRLKAASREEKKIDPVMAEVFGLAGAASLHCLGYSFFPVQFIAGGALSDENIVQMNTGEGKTLTAVLPAVWHALQGEGVHVATVNDYLAKRDCEWMGQIYRMLGLSAGLIFAGQEKEDKRAAYACDITYSTATEFGFDYLREGLVQDLAHRVMRGLPCAIVDEADSVLLDEAVTPMILSGRGSDDFSEYQKADTFARYLKSKVFANMDEEYIPDEEEHADYVVDERRHCVYLTASGVQKAERYYMVKNICDMEHAETYHRILQACKAYGVMKLDRDYIVSDGKIRIVDRNTGRVMAGRRFSEGLHQAIEAKEKVEILSESKTLSSITYQNFFRLYGRLCGMTGTAWTSRGEFEQVYGRKVVKIPTNRPCIRKDDPDRLYPDQNSKLDAVVQEILANHAKHRPVLIGTTSVEKSEVLSQRLRAAGVPHNVLNAKNHAAEAEIVSAAGRLDAVTVATNMAGRGTDILLGQKDQQEAQKICEMGGLLVIGTERHHSRRVDDQLAGRAGRQGDPGESLFFASAEDDLWLRYAPEGKKFTKSALDHAQRFAEAEAVNQRRNALEMDNIIQSQRAEILRLRERVLEEDRLFELADDLIAQEAQSVYQDCAGGEVGRIRVGFARAFGKAAYASVAFEEADEAAFVQYAIKAWRLRRDDMEGVATRLVKAVLLRAIDSAWNEHLDAMDECKRNKGMVSKFAKNPKQEFANRCLEQFGITMEQVRYSAVFALFRTVLRKPDAPKESTPDPKKPD